MDEHAIVATGGLDVPWGVPLGACDLRFVLRVQYGEVIRHIQEMTNESCCLQAYLPGRSCLADEGLSLHGLPPLLGEGG
jgi:hypothetical protein